MNRSGWEFEYLAKDLADAASKKKAHRMVRKRFWQEETERLVYEAKESGIEISEAPTSTTSTLVRGPQMVIRAELQQRMNDAHQKVQTHHNAAVEYDGWIQMLRAKPKARLKLKQPDWLYFFGADDLV